MVICLERGADLHMAQLMPLPLTVSCFSKIQIGFALLVPAHLGSPGQKAVKRVCVCVCVCACVLSCTHYVATYAILSRQRLITHYRPTFAFPPTAKHTEAYTLLQLNYPVRADDY